MKNSDSTEKIRRWFLRKAARLWPVAEGSLSFRKAPCIRDGCSACAKGEGHSSYVLYGRRKKGRFSVYVPVGLAEEVRLAVENGRKLQELIMEAGRKYTLARKEDSHVSSRRKKK